MATPEDFMAAITAASWRHWRRRAPRGRSWPRASRSSDRSASGSAQRSPLADDDDARRRHRLLAMQRRHFTARGWKQRAPAATGGSSAENLSWNAALVTSRRLGCDCGLIAAARRSLRQSICKACAATRNRLIQPSVGPVAQWLEPAAHNRLVGGSSPLRAHQN